MNYPVWEVAFGSGLLVAIVSVVHVFVSHFAVGGGLYLVLTEMRAYRTGNEKLLDWLRHHSLFFVLLTVVFGAVSGVGIWFTIGLANPSGTSALIHTFVWGWAIEWVFFFLEITAAILYLYGWNRVDRKTHLWLGWIYFIAAWMSLVVINGIITFMLTPGAWTETRDFWDGFFNPTYWPSVVFRTAIAVVLAGLYSLLTGAREKDPELKTEIVRWSARWILPGLVLLAPSAYWYVSAIPEAVWAGATGKMPTATLHADLILYFSAAMTVLAIAALLLPRKLNLAWAGLILLAAFGSLGSFEMIRESLRKPYVVWDYLYANSIYKQTFAGNGGLDVKTLNERGALKTARFAHHREVTEGNRLAAGRELFALQCLACHTLDGYRGLGSAIRDKEWTEAKIAKRLGALDKMHNKVMPPFAGTAAERAALAAYLAHTFPVAAKPEAPPDKSTPPDRPGVPTPPAAKIDAETLWENQCADCHEPEIDDPAFAGFGDGTAKTIADILARLDKLNAQMSPFEGTEAERMALARWLAELLKELKEDE